MNASVYPYPPQGTPITDAKSSREVRTSRLLKASIYCPRLGSVDVVVRNISEHGLGGKTPRDFARDEQVMVTVCGMPSVPGVVRWAWDGKFGIRTLAPIPLDAIQVAHGTHLPSSDAYNGEFEILKPMSAPARRPSLSIQRIGRGNVCDSDWKAD